MVTGEFIEIKGARQHNLKDLSLVLPKNRLVVFTGPSGSGKSSLAFDTLFAEGQRRYVQSLSSYARQFLDQMEKPDVDAINGLCPAVAIEQRRSTTNPRSTVATVTEVYDYLRVLFSTIGVPHHPRTGKALHVRSTQDLVEEALEHPASERVQILAPIIRNESGGFRDTLDKLSRDGYLRVRVDGRTHLLEDKIRLDAERPHTIEVVVDRLKIGPDVRGRLQEAVELALDLGQGLCIFAWVAAKGETSPPDWLRSNGNFDPETGYHFPRLRPRYFSYNNPDGACPACHGLGTEWVADPDLIVPDPEIKIEDMPVRPWKRGTKMQASVNKSRLRDLARHAGVALDTPWNECPSTFHQLVLHGSGNETIAFTAVRGGEIRTSRRKFEGVLQEISRLAASSQSPLTRKRLSAYLNKKPCRSCRGHRLRREILAVTLPGTESPVNIHDVCALPVGESKKLLEQVFRGVRLEPRLGEVFKEIDNRLTFLESVGLSYLSLNREASTLSGGENQRIRLATQIGSGLTGVLYILDEPSIGLHQRDNQRLIETIQRLRDLGNSVVVVEHDEETIRAADYLVDFGPGAGKRGGQIVARGTLEEVMAEERSVTGPFLNGRRQVSLPRKRQPVGKGWLRVVQARENNLKSIDVGFPVGCFTCVTGVSGSGKSTLVNDILSRGLGRILHGAKTPPGAHDRIEGVDLIERVVTVDQSPIGKSPRSNPATYCGIFDEIRALFAQLPASRIRGYKKGRFSFNTPGGRCEHCKGDGSIKLEMQFLPDIFVPCQACKGKRFERETLEITYKGYNISDVLNLTVHEALDLFSKSPALVEKLETLHQVGLGYLQLGQSGTTLSGGEAQRIKLAAELGKKSRRPTVYILDEPTTGLHVTDIELLLHVLYGLRDRGHTVIVIEHHLDMIKCADYCIDLGPEGGPGGGNLVATGSPEELCHSEKSVTATYLAPHLKHLEFTQKLVKNDLPANLSEPGNVFCLDES